MEKKCEENHKPLNNKIDAIYGFLFGKVTETNEISFTSKVNMMFKDVSDIKKWVSGSLITIITLSISSCVFFGRQLQIVEDNSKNIKDAIEYLKILDKRVTTLETAIGISQDENLEIKQVGNIKTIKIKK